MACETYAKSNIVIVGGEITVAKEKLPDIHFNQIVRDAIRDIDAGGLEVALGRGEVEWIEVLPLLDEIEYAGWVTVNRTQGNDLALDAARAVEYLKNVMLS